MKMKITAIVEKGADGLYSVYSKNRIGNSYFGGFGDSVKDAKADFQNSIEEAFAEAKNEGFAVPAPDCVQVEYRYDIPSLFNYFDYINVSKFAEFAGINESKMRAYKSGSSFPGEKTTGKIRDAIRIIGKELSSASI